MTLPKCLILNSSNEFLSVRSWNRAVRLVEDTFIPEHLLNDQEFLSKPKFIQDQYRKPKVEVIGWYDDYAHSENKKIRIPAVIRLNYCVKTKKQERLNAATLRNILIRDNWQCQYCGCKLTLRTATKDHVQATANGGRNVIENMVASCKRCNNLKADMSLSKFESEYGFNLNRKQLRKLTEEEKIMAAIKRFKSKERKTWLKTLKDNNIELW